MALDLKTDRQIFADIHHSCVLFAREREHHIPFIGKLFELQDRVFIAGVLAPHNAEYAELNNVWLAP